jgi:hypothetical protein
MAVTDGVRPAAMANDGERPAALVTHGCRQLVSGLLVATDEVRPLIPKAGDVRSVALATDRNWPMMRLLQMADGVQPAATVDELRSMLLPPMADGVEPAAMADDDSRSMMTRPVVTATDGVRPAATVTDVVERAVTMDGESRPTMTRPPPVVDGSARTVSALSAHRRTVPRCLP